MGLVVQFAGSGPKSLRCVNTAVAGANSLYQLTLPQWIKARGLSF
jgi:hypothetical protein